MVEKKRKKQRQRKTKGGSTSYNESVRAKWFCREFKLGFAQLMCKTSLIFKLHLVFALSIIFFQKDYTSQTMTWWSVDV